MATPLDSIFYGLPITSANSPVWEYVKLMPLSRCGRNFYDPFSKEDTIFKAKPARKVVNIKALKKVKEMVG